MAFIKFQPGKKKNKTNPTKIHLLISFEKTYNAKTSLIDFLKLTLNVLIISFYENSSLFAVSFVILLLQISSVSG